VTATEDDTVTAVVERLLRHDISRLPVVRDGVPVGIVARHDLLKLLARDGT
jgi:CBS domain-containing protein